MVYDTMSCMKKMTNSLIYRSNYDAELNKYCCLCTTAQRIRA